MRFVCFMNTYRLLSDAQHDKNPVTVWINPDHILGMRCVADCTLVTCTAGEFYHRMHPTHIADAIAEGDRKI